MIPIGKVARAVGDDISKAATANTSSTNGGPNGRDGSSDDGAARHARRGEGAPECAQCGGIGWLRRDVDVEHPDFGRVFPCACIADKLAERRLAGVRDASNMAGLARMTFETFKVEAPGNSPEARQALAAAYDEARTFAVRPDGWLVLSGSYGSGKTHLAAAIVNARLAEGGSALFVVVPDLLDHLRAGFGNQEGDGMDRRLDAVRRAPLLVLDDLGAQAGTAWAGEKLFQILNYRYNANLPTVVTMNVGPEELDERIRSRLGDFEHVRMVEIQALDYRGGADPGRLELSSLHLHQDATFETWDHRAGELPADEAENLHRAYDLARAYAERPSGWLVIAGDYGCGKTHLAAAAANMRETMGEKTLFVVVPDLLDHLRATFSPVSRVTYDQRFDEVRGARFLVLDDLGTESATTWAQEKLYQVLNHRYAARLPTIITMACRVDDVHPRVRARMLDKTRCRVFGILAPSYAEGRTNKQSRKRKSR
jgi:DNA replication protein DnaC